MKKNLILSFLVLSVLVMMIGMGSAQSFIDPLSGYIKGDVLVEWENSAGDTSLQLQYAEGTCATPTGDWNKLVDSGLTSYESYSWDTTSINYNGDVCLRLQSDGTTHASIDLIVDNEAPEVEVTTLNIPKPTEEDVDAEIYVDYNDNLGVVECWINWGDGSALKDCSAYGDPFYQTYEYADGDKTYDIEVTVEDAAGNSDSDSDDVSVENVAPTITVPIAGQTDVAVGQVAEFNATADDVDADLEAGLTCVWTFDSSDEVETTADNTGYCSVEYTWTSARIHTVDLTVEDKDGGSVIANQYTIKVLAPEHMTPMQQVVQDKVFKFDLDAPWGVSNKKRFQTSISGTLTCELISGPMDPSNVTNDGTGRCEVNWKPDNSERGVHSVIIKAYNGTGDYKYYSFDVTVYSWGIDLVEGWNLISIPYTPVNPDIEFVFADIKDNIAYEGTDNATILQYKAVENKWYKARTTSTYSGFTYITGQSSVELKSVVPGYGYWVKMENADTIYGIEENFIIDLFPGQNAINLATEKWNLVGRFGASASGKITDAFKSLRIHYYNKDYVSAELGVYGLTSVTSEGITTWYKVTSDSSNSINVGEGYWVRTPEGNDGRTIVIYEPVSL